MKLAKEFLGKLQRFVNSFNTNEFHLYDNYGTPALFIDGVYYEYKNGNFVIQKETVDKEFTIF